MNSEVRRAFDEWFTEHYDTLLDSARGIHRDHQDLLHHTYHACIRAAPERIMDNPSAYFHTAMWTQATKGAFKRLYRIIEATPQEVPAKDTTAAVMEREEALLLTNHLAWFDRQVLRLYLEGYNLRQVSRESGIPHTTLYQSLHRTKRKLRHALSR